MGDTTYDFLIPMINGQQVTVEWAAAEPRRIYRLLRTLVQQMLIGDKLLQGRVDLTGSGSGVFEVAESIFADLQSATVPPLSEYPLTTTSPGTLAAVKPLKDGLRELISDEAIAHNRWDIVMRKLVKIANTIVFKADGILLAAVASQVTQSIAAQAPWTGATGNPFTDAMLGGAKIKSKNQGYIARVMVTTPTGYAYAISRAATLDYLPREDAANALTTGNMQRIGGLLIMQTTNMPVGAEALIADPMMLGSIAWEELGGGYQGSANPDSDGRGLQVKRYRKEEADGVTVQARLVQAPMIQEPDAACFIEETGLAA